MNKIKNIFINLVKNFNTKYRLSFTDPLTKKFIWQIFISPFRVVAFFLVIFLFNLLIVSLLFMYTPIPNILPNYSGGYTRELVVNSISRLDSLERELNIWNIYRENIVRIIGGATPFSTDTTKVDTVSIAEYEFIAPSAIDSAFRNKILSLGSGTNNNQSTTTTRPKSSIELFMPVKGIVTKQYDLRENFRGTEFTTTGMEPVLAANNGKVIFTSWSPEEGATIQIQFGNGLLIIYKGLTNLLKVVGDNVQGGEVIGSIGDENNEKSGDKDIIRPLIVEFWLNGNSVDPSNYLNF